LTGAPLTDCHPPHDTSVRGENINININKNNIDIPHSSPDGDETPTPDFPDHADFPDEAGRDEQRTADPAPEETITFEDFVEAWNEIAEACGLAKLRKATEARKRAFRARLREYPAIADWQAAFRCLRQARWMHGDNPRGWRADPDFFLQAKSFTKLVEGQYGQADR